MRNKSNQWEQACGGTLISPHIVLTGLYEFYYVIPVSYTHLDVYKRQVLYSLQLSVVILMLHHFFRITVNEFFGEGFVRIAQKI